jgi:D-serine deaminase-like pyridoxal phosphate-dependent protein
MQDYLLAAPETVPTPALLFYPELIEQNLERLLARAGGPERLRLHVKTHKTRQIVALALRRGIRQHKCATLAEAELLAQCGAPDVLIAYPLVGPNCQRLAHLLRTYPQCRFTTLVDHPQAAQALSAVLSAAGLSVEVLLDLDVGQQRTGVPPGPAAVALYEQVARLPGLRPAGLHLYDGHNHQEDPAARRQAVQALLEPVLQLRQTLRQRGLPVTRLVAGGTPTFPIYASLNLPGLECSPGTCVLHDAGYRRRFPDLHDFTPAAVLLSRVISKPARQRLTLDLGYKAVASDPPLERRCQFLNLPEARLVLHNEEHLVVETPAADQFAPGDVVYAWPTHICPTCALHQQAYVVRAGRVEEVWPIAARDRILTI